VSGRGVLFKRDAVVVGFLEIVPIAIVLCFSLFKRDAVAVGFWKQCLLLLYCVYPDLFLAHYRRGTSRSEYGHDARVACLSHCRF
jgi:hypothetical protein